MGEISFYIHHVATNVISELITINLCDSFYVSKDSKKVEKLDLTVGQNVTIKINNETDKKYEYQEYKLSLHDENGKNVGGDPIVQKISNGEYRIKSLFKNGLFKLKVTPIIEGTTVNELSKEVLISINHKYVESFGLLLKNEQNQEILIINNQVSMFVNEEIDIKPIINSDVTKYDIVILSSDKTVVSVENGKLIALKPGKASITIKETNSNIEKQFEVVISNLIEIDNDKPIKISNNNLTFDKENNLFNIVNGNSAVISLNLTTTTTFDKVVYSSSDDKILSVGNDGTITPHKVGVVTIDMVCEDGYGTSVTYQIKIKVNKKMLIEDLNAFFYKVRKSVGHFGAFLVLGIFSTFTYFLYFKKKNWIISLPLNFIAGFYIAFLTEFIQRYVPGRSGNFNDVMIDMSGFLISSILITIIMLIINLRKNKKSST